MPQPRILLVDLAENVAEQLRSKGYNVQEGTFGRPYKTAVSDHFVPVIPQAALPGLNEQEIVVVDLSPCPIAEAPSAEKQTSLGTMDVWAPASHGVVDPRPLVMWQVRDLCDRILSHGGVFIVFVEPRSNPGYRLGHKSRSFGFDDSGPLPTSSWGFLSVLDDETAVKVASDDGEEIRLPEEATLLSPYLEGAHFSATLSRSYGLPDKQWIPLATNKYDQTIAAVIPTTDHPEATLGAIYLLPQVLDKAQLLLGLLENSFPRVFPHLFPEADALGWIHDAPYELPRVVEIADEIRRVEEEHAARIETLREDAAVAQAAGEWQYDLLRGTDTAFVAAVKRAFEELGFTQVEDVDSANEDGLLREDLRVHDRSPLLLVEAKGITGTGREADLLQIVKYLAPRMRELGRTDIQGLSVVNHQRNLPPLSRQRNPFQRDVLVNAQEQQIGLLTGVDLFRLVRNAHRFSWPHEHVSNLLYATGRIDPVPSHYEFIGTIDGYWEQVSAVGIRIEAMALRPGDKIAFELSINFVEENIESVELDNTQVAEGVPGQHVAVRSALTKSDARKGTRVFHVHNSNS